MTKFYIDIAELAAESLKAASLNPLYADEGAHLSLREAAQAANERRGNVSLLTDQRDWDIRKRST